MAATVSDAEVDSGTTVTRLGPAGGPGSVAGRECRG